MTNAVASEVTCTRWSCTIAPSAYLEYTTGYTACLASDVSYSSTGGAVTEFSGFMASFTTVLSSIKLVRLDGTELELSDQPIPRMVHVKYSFSSPFSDEAGRTAFESSVTLVDEDNDTVDGSWTWADDFLSATFIPTWRLEYRTEYTINVDNSILPSVSLSKALSAGDMSFTTMAKNDINGDGFADVIVGAKGFDSGVTNKGRAYVFLGSAAGIGDCDLSAGCVPDTIITGGNPGDRLGYHVSTAGDVNADGYEDIIVGAYKFDGGKGRAYVFLGSASGIGNCDLSDPTCVPNTTITGGNTGDGLGYNLSTAGDVNADGYEDIIVGAYKFDGEKGRAYVLLGSASGIANCDMEAGCVPHATITGGNTGDGLGKSGSNAGDVDGDGYDDIIVGAYGFDGGGDDKGRAYVFLGSASGIADCDMEAGCVPHATITGENNSDYLGVSVSTAGDVNADGYDDIIVGAYGYPGDGNWHGRVYVFLGSASGIADCDLFTGCTAPTSITGGGSFPGLGIRVNFAGDVNADGYNDIIVGASWLGRVYIFLGSGAGISDCDLTPPSTCTPDATITEEATDQLGDAVSTAGDVNGDGYDDVIIGALRYPNLGFIGRAYIFMGSAASISDCDLSAGCYADTTLTGESEDDWFGGFN